MDRAQVLHWFEEHPGALHGDPAEVVARCERAVRRHAEEDAWLAAKQYVEKRLHEWEHDWGYHASEAFAASETCHRLARELREHEPGVEPGAEEHLAGGAVLGALEPEGREFLRAWILEIAGRTVHETWKEICRYTDRRARSLVRDRHLSRENSWEDSRSYPRIAAEIAGILARDYSRHAHPR